MTEDAPVRLADLEDDYLLTTHELTRLLRCSIATLEQHRARGTGPTFLRLGTRTIFYRAAAVRAWIAARERRSVAEYRGADGSIKPANAPPLRPHRPRPVLD